MSTRSPHYWTVEEAQAYLPRLRRLLAVVRRASELATVVRSNGHAQVRAEPEQQALPDIDDGGGPEETGGPLGPVDLRSALAELEEQGIVLRDPVRGLVDFPAQHPGGQVVYLCWRLGEDELGWWHKPEDGFAGRQPLPLPPTL